MAFSKSTFPSKRTEWILLGTIILLSGLCFLLMLNPFLTVVNLDSAIFCLLGQAIAQGQGYLLLSEPNPQPYFTFPPLLPLQIAGLMNLFGNTDIQAMQPILKASIQLMFLVSLPFFYGWTRDLFGKPLALALTLLVGLNPVVFKYSSDVLSDVPYWAYSSLAIFYVWRWNQSKNQPNGWRWFAGALIAIALSALCRQIGIALILAFLLMLTVQRHWKPLILAAVVCGSVILGWQGYEHNYRSTHAVEADGLNQAGVQAVLDKSPVKLEFIKHFMTLNPVSDDQAESVQPLTHPDQLLAQGLKRFDRYSGILLDQVFPPLTVRINGEKENVFHLFPFVILLWGTLLLGFRQVQSKFPFLGYYVLLYGGVLMVYPYISPRFLLPVLPLLLCYGVAGLSQIANWIQEKASVPSGSLKWATAALVPCFVLLTLCGGHLPQTIRWVNAGYKIKKADIAPSLKPENKGFYESLVWLKGNTPTNSLIISRKPPVTYYYSGRKSIAFPFTKKEPTFLSFIEHKAQQYHAQFRQVYLIEDTAFGETKTYLSPVLEKNPKAFRLVYTNPTSGSRIWEWVQ